MSPFLDVNVPMYAAGKDHPHKAACIRCMSLIAEEELNVVINSEVLQEVLHRYSRLGLRGKGIMLARNLITLVPVVLPVRREDIELAIELLQKYPDLESRDVVHLATMQNNGLEEIISTDTHFDDIPSIQRIPPERF